MSAIPIEIVDLFAGPGGLGEGFSSLDGGKAFKILVSAEMESSAYATLRLRSFFREIRGNSAALAGYYAFCNGQSIVPYNEFSTDAWQKSGNEARQLKLGETGDNAILDSVLDAQLSAARWILIGGPPCQAYSLVGRARNTGTPSYVAEEDHRHFLYKEYMRIIKDRRPPVFVMENVKGILSSRVAGKRIFHEILKDLADPDGVFGEEGAQPGYRIHSLVTNTFFSSEMDPADIDPQDFVVRSEEFGIPQARHRVILLGVRTDINAEFRRLAPQPRVTVKAVIGDLPPLRSRVSSGEDSSASWEAVVRSHYSAMAKDAKKKGMGLLASWLERNADSVRTGLSSGSLRYPKQKYEFGTPHAADWYLDRNLNCWLNHQSRSHMSSDLQRYAYAATYTDLHSRSPKGHEEFSLDGLAPNHDNWKTGKFADRFRVQRSNAPATTITSHIAKDGHYFIHYDPTQCRSLTVREAARLQTFPDNYFFQGNRTEQYHQVGNAVPPRLALLIAAAVQELMATQTAL